jgi:hypothetical protein
LGLTEDELQLTLGYSHQQGISYLDQIAVFFQDDQLSIRLPDGLEGKMVLHHRILNVTPQHFHLPTLLTNQLQTRPLCLMFLPDKREFIKVIQKEVLASNQHPLHFMGSLTTKFGQQTHHLVHKEDTLLTVVSSLQVELQMHPRLFF